jgi:inhibitor of cysteine peptidase
MAVIRIGAEHKDERVTATVGDTLDLVLPENATTGYQWEVDEPGGAVEIATSELIAADDVRAGATGKRHVVIRAVRPGNSRLSMRLRRSWEPAEKAAESYAVDIEVT